MAVIGSSCFLLVDFWNSFSSETNRCLLPSFGSFGQAVSEEKIFRNRPIRNKNCLWRPCLLMYLDEMSIFRSLTFHILIFSSETSQSNELKLGKKHLWKVLYICLDPLTNMATTGNSCFWLADFFKVSEEKIKMWKVNERQTPSDGKTTHCLWQGELKQ
jgi:hypothetical protein